jgi:hypothetical protein
MIIIRIPENAVNRNPKKRAIKIITWEANERDEHAFCIEVVGEKCQMYHNRKLENVSIMYTVRSGWKRQLKK